MKTLVITEGQKERIKRFLYENSLDGKKVSSAQDQVHNKVNSGIMDIVTGCGAMEEGAEPESDRYNIGFEDGSFSNFGHISESVNDRSFDFSTYMKSILEFMKNDGLNVYPFPKIKLNWEKQDGLFIKTGYYEPEAKTIVVFCCDRNPKDILRTFAHECIHHSQNLDGKDLSFSSADDVKDNKRLEEIEGEAYLKGNVYFRKWTEYFKNGEQDMLNENATPFLRYGININVDDTDWLQMIFNGKKTVETRDGATFSQWLKHKGEQIGLVKTTKYPSKTNPTGMLVGYATIVDVIKYTPQNFNNDYQRHRVPYTTDFGKNCRCGLVLSNIHQLDSPIKLAPKGQQAVRPIEYAQINESRNHKGNNRRYNDKGNFVPDICPKCGSKVGVYIQGEPVYLCSNKKCRKYFGTMPCHLDEYIAPKDVDLSSFKLKSELNPKFWKDNHLDSRIRIKLLDIADDFIDFLGIDWIKPDDITITGSLANYNWNKKFSDIDLHIIVDFSKVDKRTDFVKKYFDAQRKLWNEEHEGLEIFGFPIEVYVQDKNEKHSSTGVYSLDKNKWLTEPDKNKLSDKHLDKEHIKKQVAHYVNIIDDLEERYNSSNGDKYKSEQIYDKVDALFDELKGERTEGLKNSNSEMTDENIIWKSLRRMKYIEKMMDLLNKTYNTINSLS